MPRRSRSTRSGASTPRSTASCARTATRRSASSTTSGSTRRVLPHEAADEAGIAFVCLYACYLRGGIPRFRQASVAEYLTQLEALRDEGIAVGVAPHSVRACPADALRELGAYAAEHGLPLHVHADEQPREIEECLAEHGLRPIELLARERLPRPAHVGRPRDPRRRARARSARATPAPRSVCARRPRRTSATASCRSRASAIAGSAVHRLRLERAHRPARGAAGARRDRAAARPARAASIDLDSLLDVGSRGGAPGARARATWPDAVVDLDHPQLRGIDPADVYGALIFALHERRPAEDVAPVARSRQVRTLGGLAVQAPRSVVGVVAVARRGGPPLRPARSACPRATRCTT